MRIKIHPRFGKNIYFGIVMILCHKLCVCTVNSQGYNKLRCEYCILFWVALQSIQINARNENFEFYTLKIYGKILNNLDSYVRRVLYRPRLKILYNNKRSYLCISEFDNAAKCTSKLVDVVRLIYFGQTLPRIKLSALVYI